MAFDDILAAGEFKNLRSRVHKEATNKPEYAWALPATQTTDAFVAQQLAETPPSIRFDPGRFEAHLRAASELLDRALARQSELAMLEERSFIAFFDLHLAQMLQPYNLAIAKVSLKADRVQGNAGTSDADEGVLTSQDTIQTQARQIRLMMHQADGHPLNYGQRIERLRRLYADSVRAIIERLQAVRIGLAHAGAGKRAPVPVWNEASSSNLANLVEWTRNAIRLYERVSESQFEYTRALFLGKENLFRGGISALLTELSLDRDHVLEFDVLQSHLHSAGVSRISGVAVALAFNENVESFTSSLPQAEIRGQFSVIDDWHPVASQR